MSRVFLSPALLALWGAAAAPLQATAPAAGSHDPVPRSWVIARFDAEIRVHQSGIVEVKETIRVRFSGSYNGIFRTIPIEYTTPGGFNYTLRLDVESVTDEAGRSLRHEISREGRNRKIKIWIPDARDATRTVVIRYRVKNGLRFFEEEGEEWDELYWNVTGTEWPVPIEAASARVHLPSMVSGVRAVAYTGGFGSGEQAAEVVVRDHVVQARTLRELGFREGLTVAVAWDSRRQPAPAGTEGRAAAGGVDDGSGPSEEALPAASGPYLVRRPTAIQKLADFLRSNWPLSAPLLLFLFMYRHWQTRGRDPARRPIAAQYEPPEDLTPSEAGVLVDNRPDMRDVTAMLVDLAVRGHIRIEETEEKKLFGLITEREHEFVRRTDSAEWQDLKRHERELLDALFEGGAIGRVSVSELENEFYEDLPKIRDGIFDELLARRYYRRRPDRVVVTYLAAAVGVAAAVILGGILVSQWLGTSSLSAVLGGILSAAVVAGFGFIMPARTIRGARALEKVLGFEEFLSRVESDRYRRMITGPEMFEKYLPFAMALGVEKKWAGAFDGIFREPPEWYHGSGYASFRPTLFVSDLSHMTGRTASAMASSPRSSGGSAFSGGGGFSGGGFGGGGGGAF
ncbi:MAG: DUF2207 domain-containing protein [Gemmatimonadota bacterium]